MSEQNTTATTATRGSRRVLQGTVTSDKMDKTITVEVNRRVKHPLYEKFINRRTRVHAHDENNDAKVGDIVQVTETRPLSKLKRFRLTKVVTRAVTD
ncbi:MAG: 30S ribosomal protein S17 [Planctomycetota bacterium]|nr:30S ribosomal protein S17 [Planctomycetota bacterium]MDA0932890.1 30S ribosomal protein S17 [Planctomycetota bacterium]MDA1221152.1 30S ribosomal protein S17 [Planctomycetota bacterium]